jgi:hypothetical protein
MVRGRYIKTDGKYRQDIWLKVNEIKTTGKARIFMMLISL